MPMPSTINSAMNPLKDVSDGDTKAIEDVCDDKDRKGSDSDEGGEEIAPTTTTKKGLEIGSTSADGDHRRGKVLSQGNSQLCEQPTVRS